MYVHSLLIALGLGPEHTRITEGQVVAAIDEPLLAEHSLTLKLEPELIDPPQPAGKAHALVQGWPESRKAQKKIARKLARAARCSYPAGPWDEIDVLAGG